MKKLIIMSLVASSLLANTYVMQNSSISQKNKEIGTIIIGTKVDIVKKDNKNSEIKLKGYRPKGGKIIYDTLGVLSSSVNLNDAKVAKVLGVETDEYENEWEVVELIASIDNANLGEKDVINEGKELFEERCGTCHALHPYDEFSKNVWPSTIKSMQDNASLDENEYYQMVKYLQRVAPGDE
ncbi:molybdopterin-containing oxidoreductase IV, DMSO/TMAO/BSO reductase family, monoheme c-type cytochrome [Campylobacter sp. RM5004]|uniref:hypothetical protein n=1 Tax=Campylobacter sp. RM5004 TaxID=1660078 RepID=UPI001EFAE485|nr:hypothetical protein [Campylobacter sp. RM5004]ULO01583.1 molybdopterin-containing oxidoreductase IV, DMSO/TMAO/BSO reductase family, monoheme c-type cytochrome [Campylobacter sp. RM5004]